MGVSFLFSFAFVSVLFFTLKESCSIHIYIFSDSTSEFLGKGILKNFPGNSDAQPVWASAL